MREHIVANHLPEWPQYMATSFKCFLPPKHAFKMISFDINVGKPNYWLWHNYLSSTVCNYSGGSVVVIVFFFSPPNNCIFEFCFNHRKEKKNLYLSICNLKLQFVKYAIVLSLLCAFWSTLKDTNIMIWSKEQKIGNFFFVRIKYYHNTKNYNL